MKKIILVLIIQCISTLSIAQSVHEPEVGQLFPNFELNELLYYSRKSARISDFKGKYLILEFFNKDCTSCVASWPHLNDIQRYFKGDLQIFLVGSSRNNPQFNLHKKEQIEGMRQMYLRFQKKLKLDLPVALNTLAYEDLGVFAGPELIWIDRNGVVKAITTGDLTIQNVKLFLNDISLNNLSDDESPHALAEKSNMLKLYLDRLHSFDTLTNVYCRSTITKWKGNQPHQLPVMLNKYGEMYTLGIDLKNLYRCAYGLTTNSFDFRYGKVAPSPILELRDSVLFELDFWKVTPNDKVHTLYNYALKLPIAMFSQMKALKIMQQDLNRYFGFTAQMEQRMMPYWRLIAAEKVKKLLSNANDKPYYNEPISHAGFTAILPINSGNSINLVNKIASINNSDLPVVDETGITGNISITIKANLTDFDDLRRAYHEQGLDLVKGYKMMDVLVIRDAEPEKK